MAKFGPSAADQPAGKNEIVMLKSVENKTVKPSARKIRAIKNAHSETELNDSGNRWAAHEGAYMTLADVVAAEATKNHK
jgi:hypothetical protein